MGDNFRMMIVKWLVIFWLFNLKYKIKLFIFFIGFVLFFFNLYWFIFYGFFYYLECMVKIFCSLLYNEL